MRDHWLARPSSIRLLWRVFFVILALCVLAGLVIEPDAHFAVEEIFGFGAWFGFLACAALIAIARAGGLILKRPDTYYEKGGEHD